MRTDTTQEYNGWANWVTWNVNLWLSNDENLYNQARSTRDADGLDFFTQMVMEDGTPDMITHGVGYEGTDWEAIWEGLQD